MSTEIAKQEKTPIAVGSRGVQLRSYEDAFRFAKSVIQSGLAPDSFKTAEQVLIAIQFGAEVGFAPMQALQSISVINRRPCIWGDGLPALVYSSGNCEYIDEWIEGEGDNRVAVCETKRKGSSKPVRGKFSVADAKQAGLWQTEAKVRRKNRQTGTFYETENDSPWYRYPERMLQMRARAFCLRDAYADALRGLQVREEVEDYTHGIPAEVTEPAKPRLLSEIPVEPETVEDAETEPVVERSKSFQFYSDAIDETPNDDVDRVQSFYTDIQLAEAEGSLNADDAKELREKLKSKIPY